MDLEVPNDLLCLCPPQEQISIVPVRGRVRKARVIHAHKSKNIPTMENTLRFKKTAPTGLVGWKHCMIFLAAETNEPCRKKRRRNHWQCPVSCINIGDSPRSHCCSRWRCCTPNGTTIRVPTSLREQYPFCGRAPPATAPTLSIQRRAIGWRSTFHHQWEMPVTYYCAKVTIFWKVTRHTRS